MAIVAICNNCLFFGLLVLLHIATIMMLLANSPHPQFFQISSEKIFELISTHPPNRKENNFKLKLEREVGVELHYGRKNMRSFFYFIYIVSYYLRTTRGGAA